MDGIEVLDSLFHKYPNSESDFSESQAAALRNILAIILWGEYAAWTISSEMSAKFTWITDDSDIRRLYKNKDCHWTNHVLFNYKKCEELKSVTIVNNKY